MNDRRLARLAEQIKQRLATVLQRDLADPKLGLVTISRIELDKEFTQCKAYWSVIAAKGKEDAARRAYLFFLLSPRKDVVDMSRSSKNCWARCACWPWC